MSDSTAPETDNNHNHNLRQPKKRFVGRRTAEAQAQQNGSQNDVETTTVQKGKSPHLKAIYQRTSLLTPYSHTPANTKNLKPSTPRNSQRPRHQLRNHPPPKKLLLRNPQNNSPHPHPRRKAHCPPIPRRSSHLRNDHLRYPHTILPRHRNIDHGRRDLRRMLYRRLHRASSRLRFTGALRALLLNPCRRY